MNCPHCQKELAENQARCPHCGASLLENASASIPQNNPRSRFPWLCFLIVVAPAIFNFLLASLGVDSTEAGNLMGVLTFGGSPVAGIVSAILLVRWKKGELSSAAIGSVIGFSLLLSVVSFVLCFVGCAAGFSISNG
jgi:zinc ribbon protein